MSIIDNHINEIERLCKSNEVKTLYVFGSVLTDKFNNDQKSARSLVMGYKLKRLQ